MANAINITSLQRAAETYQRDFMVLPYAMLMETIKALRIKTLEVANEDVIIEKQRKGGLTVPYNLGGNNDITNDELSKLQEKRLKVETGVLKTKDNILNYKEKNVLWDPSKNKIDNKSKKHPLEKEIIGDIIKTCSEDIIDALFPAERDVNDASPLGLFDGFDKKIDDGITAGDISIAKGNLVNSGALSAPSDSSDYTAWTRLVAWVRSKHIRFSKKPILRLPTGVYLNCKDALQNKLKYKDVLFENFQEMLRDQTRLMNLIVVVSDEMGTGTRISLAQENLFEFGISTMTDTQFVQVWQDNDDPNIAKYWLQFMAGTRIVSWHPKVFMINEGIPTANQLSGDYLS